jgi:hypothetical protein
MQNNSQAKTAPIAGTTMAQMHLYEFTQPVLRDVHLHRKICGHSLYSEHNLRTLQGIQRSDNAL